LSRKAIAFASPETFLGAGSKRDSAEKITRRAAAPVPDRPVAVGFLSGESIAWLAAARCRYRGGL